MVHDVAWREAPETFPARGRRWHERALRRCIDHAALVITPSDRTAALVRDAGMRADRIAVIAEGCDHLPPADAAGAGAVLARIGVRGSYLLTVSTLEPRKNLERLMAAYDRVRERLPEPWPLVVVGPKGWGESVSSPPGGVKLAGPVNDAVLAGLYAGARCVVYVPLVEGWGLPPIEAMAACTPVVASPLPSTGGAALEVDPLDIDAIGAGMLAAAGDEARRSALVTAGLLRAGELTWERTARDHTRAWEGLL
jgi:glycosyltransferase involved in cell wall biosynthesis